MGREASNASLPPSLLAHPVDRLGSQSLDDDPATLPHRGGPLETSSVLLELPAWAERFVAEWPIPRTTTAADGSFELKGVELGSNVLVVRS